MVQKTTNPRPLGLPSISLRLFPPLIDTRPTPDPGLVDVALYLLPVWTLRRFEAHRHLSVKGRRLPSPAPANQKHRYIQVANQRGRHSAAGERLTCGARSAVRRLDSPFQWRVPGDRGVAPLRHADCARGTVPLCVWLDLLPFSLYLKLSISRD